MGAFTAEQLCKKQSKPSNSDHTILFFEQKQRFLYFGWSVCSESLLVRQGGQKDICQKNTFCVVSGSLLGSKFLFHSEQGRGFVPQG